MNTNLRKVVIIVAVLNLAYFGVEFAVAVAIGSVSFFAGSVDFSEDASVNFLIAIAIGWSATTGIVWAWPSPESCSSLAWLRCGQRGRSSWLLSLLPLFPCPWPVPS